MNTIDFIASFFSVPYQKVLSLPEETINKMVDAVEDEEMMDLHHLGYAFVGYDSSH